MSVFRLDVALKVRFDHQIKLEISTLLERMTLKWHMWIASLLRPFVSVYFSIIRYLMRGWTLVIESR